MSFSKKNILNFLLILLLVADIDYSFRQHEHKTLDGDMALIVAPSENYEAILKEPFGLKASLHHEKYAGSNRYYVHQAMVVYYKQLYPVFSNFFNDKLDCLYKFTGLFQLLIQLFITILLVYYAIKNQKINTTKVLFLTVLITSLFQTHGFASSIGVIDHSVTYTFFYAMPLMLLMLFLLPYLRWNVEEKSKTFKFIFGVIWLAFAFILSMTSALIPPLGTMIVGLLLLSVIIKTVNEIRININKQKIKLPYFTIITLSVFFLCCVYSYYVGLFNAENSSTDTSLSFRYAKLMEGLKHYFVHDVSFLLIAVLLLVNFILIRKNKIQISYYTYVMLALAVVYIFLLPLGGYRSYRPFIIRNDTFLPVTILLFYFIARSTTIVLSKTIYTRFYLFLLCIIIGIFTYADKPHFDEDRCQRMQIKRLQESTEMLTVLPSHCSILTWDTPKDTMWTRYGSEMLYFWKITDKVKVYQHE